MWHDESARRDVQTSDWERERALVFDALGHLRLEYLELRAHGHSALAALIAPYGSDLLRELSPRL